MTSCIETRGQKGIDHDHLEYLTKKDLIDYFTSDEIIALLDNFYDKTEIDALVDRPYFVSAKNSSSPNTVGGGVFHNVICGNAIRDTHAAYDPFTGIFTAPIEGMYHFEGTIYVYNVNTNHPLIDFGFTQSGVLHWNRVEVDILAGISHIQQSFALDIMLTPGAFMTMYAYSPGGVQDMHIYGSSSSPIFTTFSGYMVEPD